MKVDFVVKGAWVFMTYRQCFEKRDVAVAGEKIYAVSPAICYPDVTMIDGSGMYMIPGLVDIHMHIESSMTYPAEFSRITLLYGVTTVVPMRLPMCSGWTASGGSWGRRQSWIYSMPSLPACRPPMTAWRHRAQGLGRRRSGNWRVTAGCCALGKS